MKETVTQWNRRLEKARKKYHEKRDVENVIAKRIRLEKYNLYRSKWERAQNTHQRKTHLESRSNSARLRFYNQSQTKKKEASLKKQCELHKLRRATESQSERKNRLKTLRNSAKIRRAEESQSERENRLMTLRDSAKIRRAEESQSERENHLKTLCNSAKIRQAEESQSEREDRFLALREYDTIRRATKSQSEREAHLECERQRRQQLNASEQIFKKAINIFCDKICEVCTKKCYSSQVTLPKFTDTQPFHLPSELKNKIQLLLCHRCKKTLLKRKSRTPTKAYWNKLDPGKIPEVIKILTQAEQRILSRIIPFVKIVKFEGRFGQYVFKGQSILFAQDLFEVSEKLPKMLPRSPEYAGIVVIHSKWW